MRGWVVLAVSMTPKCTAGFNPFARLKSIGVKKTLGRAATAGNDEMSNRELLAFGVPALALWIAGPVLTLIDTAAVGRYSVQSATEIAALGPATSLCDAAGYVFAFLNVASTNLLASAQDPKERALVAGRGLVWAIACGLGTTIVLRLGSNFALRVFVGGASQAVLEKSRAYVDVRALGMVFALASNVLTACLLGAKDSISPLGAQAISATTNVFGDYFAVAKLHRGVRGAAEATLAAQVVSTLFLAKAAVGKIGVKFDFSARRGFDKFAGPVLVLVLSKIASFGAMTHAASELGDVALASHQLAFTLYLVASLVLEALAAQTAQAFVPPLRNQPRRCAALARQLGKLASVAALFTALVALSLGTFGGSLFTPDVHVAASLRQLSPALALGVLLHGAVAHGEGLLLALADLKLVGIAYAVSALVFPPVLLIAAHRSSLLQSAHNVWAFFAVFQLARAVFFQLRANQLLARLGRK